jgi:hypothetical protein
MPPIFVPVTMQAACTACLLRPGLVCTRVCPQTCRVWSGAVLWCLLCLCHHHASSIGMCCLFALTLLGCLPVNMQAAGSQGLCGACQICAVNMAACLPPCNSVVVVWCVPALYSQHAIMFLLQPWLSQPVMMTGGYTQKHVKSRVVNVCHARPIWVHSICWVEGHCNDTAAIRCCCKNIGHM